MDSKSLLKKHNLKITTYKSDFYCILQLTHMTF